MKKAFRSALFGLAALVIQGAMAYTDAEITNCVLRSTCYRHSRQQRTEYNRAVQMCGSDSNRLVRLLQEIAVAHTNRAESMIVKLGMTWNPVALPFLYGCVTNRVTGMEAVRAIFRIEGLTTNSLDQLVRFLETASISGREKTSGCDLLLRGGRGNETPAMWRIMLDHMIDYAATATNSMCSLDDVLIRADPIYSRSRRRLQALRNYQGLSLNDAQRAYVTNAINELIAYPEANLND